MVEWWNVTGAAVFAAAAFISLGLNKTPTMRGIRMFFIYLTLTSLYLVNTFEFLLITRSDGNQIFVLRYIFEAFALYIIGVSIIGKHKTDLETPHLISIINAGWALLHALAAAAESTALTFWLFSVGVVMWAVLLYFMWTYSKCMTERYSVDWLHLVLFAVLTLLFHVAFIVGQPGTGRIGVAGTGIFYLILDGILYIPILLIICFLSGNFDHIPRPNNNNNNNNNNHHDHDIENHNQTATKQETVIQQQQHQIISSSSSTNVILHNPTDGRRFKLR